MKDLREDTREELKYMIEHYPFLTANCTGHPPTAAPAYALFTRNNPQEPIMLTGSNLKEIDPNKPLIIFIQGWLTELTSSRNVKLKEAYLKRYDCNFVIIDWSKLAFQPYSSAFCDVKSLGLQISKFVCTIFRQLQIPLGDMHVIGHTMGGQIAGSLGQNTQLQCKEKLGRITALDPAGHLFQNLMEKDRLDKSDALFVDVIHADESTLGTWLNCGHVDFHPNCGLLQPGCPSTSQITNDTLVTDGKLLKKKVRVLSPI